MYDILFEPIVKVISLKQLASKALIRLGILNIRDLIMYKPYYYKPVKVEPELIRLSHGQEIITTVQVNRTDIAPRRTGPQKIHTSNATGELMLVFFNPIPPFLQHQLREGNTITVSGKIERYMGGLQMNHPDILLQQEMKNPLEAVYNLSYGITNRQMRQCITKALGFVKGIVNSTQAKERAYMLKLLEYLTWIHIATNVSAEVDVERKILDANNALVEQELYANQASLSNLRATNKKAKQYPVQISEELKIQLLNKLGFTLTREQQKVIEEIEQDQKSHKQMIRLLQGDVGSGKTLVTIVTALNTISSGQQVCLMTPTDILSQQHYDFFCTSLSGLTIQNNNIRVALLTGKTTTKEKQRIKQELENGTINILLGTHAIFQDRISFARLGYVIIDEQHKFGVQQRISLINKGLSPDILIMTATPIPRSLKLTMFGDMDISQILEKPESRLPVITSAISSNRIEEVMRSLKKNFEQQERAFWVCPLIDCDNNLEDEPTMVTQKYSDVTMRARKMEALYPLMGAVLHGKMKTLDKEAIMHRFKMGEIQYLIATTVIEVGIDVPEATIVVIENAEKFGLAQLHQIRGRVGRGTKQSYCVLIYNPQNLTKTAYARLKVMRESNDGFYISEQDLKLRGSGEILGTKQSGKQDFFFADPQRDIEVLLKMNRVASEEQTQLQEFQIKLFAKRSLHYSKNDECNLVN